MSVSQSKARRMLGAVAVVVLGSGALATLTSGPAMAAGPGCVGATIEVTTNTDAALRAAFTTASGLAGPQTICIDSGLGTITLGGTELAYSAATTPGLTLKGNGVTISGNHTSRILNVGANFTLESTTILDGTTAASSGAVFVNGNITLTDSIVSGSTTSAIGGVGGVFANGTATLTNSTISDNTSIGDGGLFANGTVSLTNSTVSGNHAGSHGGVFANGTVTLTNSTVSGNTATAANSYGGVFANGNVTLTRSTVSGNTGTGFGGLYANGNVSFTNSTLSGNTASGATGVGGGVHASGNIALVYATVVGNSAPTGANLDATGSLTTFGSVIAQAAGGGANCVVTGSTTSQGYNLSDDASAGVSCHLNAATDLVSTSNAPSLGTITDNGGPTATRLPDVGSPLVDAIPLASCQTGGAAGITTDQRGLARPAVAGCDIGSVEVQAVPPTTTTTTSRSTTTTTATNAKPATPVNASPSLTG
jgi:hypothetical protein